MIHPAQGGPKMNHQTKVTIESYKLRSFFVFKKNGGLSWERNKHREKLFFLRKRN